MGNEISTIVGAAGVVGTSVVAGVTFGQVDALNNAVKETSKFTADSFMKSNVRHVGELTGTAVAAAVTLGKVEGVNKHLKWSAGETGKTLLETGNNTANGIPVVGHIKGGIHWMAGDTAGCDAALNSATRATGVVGGVLGGLIAGGPPGAIAGGIAGGAAMDGIKTGFDSANAGKLVPAGQLAAWKAAVDNKSPQALVGGIVGMITAPVMDGPLGQPAR